MGTAATDPHGHLFALNLLAFQAWREPDAQLQLWGNMTGFAHQLKNDVYAGIDDQLAAEDSGPHFALMPEERIGALRPRSRWQRFVRRLLILTLLPGIGWAAFKANERWPGWHETLAAMVTSTTEVAPSATLEQPLQAPLPAELPTTEVVAATPPSPPESVAVENKAAAQETPIETGALPEPPAKEPPASEDPRKIIKDPLTDPIQKKAAAAGLSPDLARVLLSKLTQADFKNASTAVGRAFAEVPDSASFVWPRDAKSGQVSFRVHFVQGAAVGCRRYVVTIAKDGWSTTAPAMQKCGPSKALARTN